MNTPKKSVAIVTGASSGIGASIAETLSANHFSVVLAARSEGDLLALKEKINASGGDAIVIATDLRDEQATIALIEKTMAHYQRIDVLVNNAGYSPAASLEQLTRDKIRQVFEVNLFSSLQLSSLVIPIMRDQGNGRIINMSSLTSSFSAPLATTYAATKAGMEAATDCLRLELNPWNIHQSAIIPGFVDTPTFEKSSKAGEKLRNDPNNPYRKLMISLSDFADSQVKNAASPQQVAEAVLLAATQKNPREYYYVPFSTRVFAGLMKRIKAKTKDWMLRKIYSLDKHHC